MSIIKVFQARILTKRARRGRGLNAQAFSCDLPSYDLEMNVKTYWVVIDFICSISSPLVADFSDDFTKSMEETHESRRNQREIQRKRYLNKK